MVTSATAATTYFATESGPETFTEAGFTWTGPSWKPSGTVPVWTWTGTVYVVYGSSWTRTVRGSKSSTMKRGSMEVTLTLWRLGPAVGSTPDRSTVASQVAGVGPGPTSPLMMYRMWVTGGIVPRTTALVGTLLGLIGTGVL